MKVNKERTAYRSVTTTLKRLGLTETDITGVINYIKFIYSNNLPIENVTKKSSVSITKKGTALDSIIATLANNPEEMYNIERISKESGIAIKTIRTYIKQLRTSRKVKVVGCDMSSHGPAKLLYQSYKSPLKALKTVTQKQGFDSINNFVKIIKNY